MKTSDFIVGFICRALLIIAIPVFCICTLVLLRDISFSSQLKNPAAIYEIGEIVNDEYQVVATDSKNTLWLQKPDDDCTYVAVASSDYNDGLSFYEKFKWLWNKSLKESVNIEITDNVGGKESGNFE